MTKKELWLKLFHENDTALVCAIHFCERFITDEQLRNGVEFIAQKKNELYEDIPPEQVALVFDDSRA